MIRLLFLRTRFFLIGLECSLSCRKLLALLDYALFYGHDVSVSI